MIEFDGKQAAEIINEFFEVINRWFEENPNLRWEMEHHARYNYPHIMRWDYGFPKVKRPLKVREVRHI